MKTFVPMSKFGKDHWSTFAYIETRIVDHKGEPNKRHMRCNNKRHPQHAHIDTGKEYPTILFGGVKLHDHDDWDCLDDLEQCGLLTQPKMRGTGLFPVYELTDTGKQVAAQLREHKSAGGSFANFVPSGFKLERF